jgi:hypothetical protein
MTHLIATPIDLASANDFVTRLHRHHKPVRGHKFSIAASDDLGIRGVVIVGRPVSRILDDGLTLEVTRLCTDGRANACSFLYGAAARAAFALGYRRIGTYIRADELGTSLVGAGWRMVAQVKGRSWDCASRPRIDQTEIIDRLRFERVA